MHRYFNFTIIVIASLLISACGAQIAKMHGIDIIDPFDPQAVEAATTVEPDPHTGLTKVAGPPIFHDNNILGKVYFLRGWKSKNLSDDSGSIQVYVLARFDKWAFLDTAYANGKKLDTSQIDRKVGSCSGYGCSLQETIGINLNISQLRDYAKNGLSFKVLGKRDSITMIIPAGYFSGFLAAYQRAN